jgi:hypothetical protein
MPIFNESTKLLVRFSNTMSHSVPVKLTNELWTSTLRIWPNLQLQIWHLNHSPITSYYGSLFWLYNFEGEPLVGGCRYINQKFSLRILKPDKRTLLHTCGNWHEIWIELAKYGNLLIKPITNLCPSEFSAIFIIPSIWSLGGYFKINPNWLTKLNIVGNPRGLLVTRRSLFSDP